MEAAAKKKKFPLAKTKSVKQQHPSVQQSPTPFRRTVMSYFSSSQEKKAAFYEGLKSLKGTVEYSPKAYQTESKPRFHLPTVSMSHNVLPARSLTTCLNNDKDQARINLVQKLIGRMKDSKEMQKQYIKMLISSKVTEEQLSQPVLTPRKLKPS